MKIRFGFVSNSSSSSSYVCDVCGNSVISSDGLYETGMICCVVGHTFCEDHKTDHKLTDQEQEIKDDTHEYPITSCPICQFFSIKEKDAIKYLLIQAEKKMMEVKDDIKNSFTGYKEFTDYLKAGVKK